MRITRHRLGWTAAAVCLWALAAGVATAQTPSCQVTYTKSWEGGNGFGANIVITNNGPAITNGWTLIFSFPNGQRLQNGWPVSFTQPAGSAQMTVASNADWNRSIGSGGSFTAGFNGTFSGTNNSPTAFTLNGTACNGGTTPPTNTPPSVSLTSPTSGQQFANGATIPLAATASDNGSVSRVEFRVDGTLVSTDTSSPYSFTNPALAAGSHSAQATAFDNATPPLSTSTALIPFTVLAAPMGASIVVNPATLNIAGGATGTSNVRLSAAPTANVVVTLTRSGSTVITSSPGTVTLTTGNWSTGVNVTFTAAAGTTAATSTFAAAAPNYTGASITVNRTTTHVSPEPASTIRIRARGCTTIRSGARTRWLVVAAPSPISRRPCGWIASAPLPATTAAAPAPGASCST